MDVCVCVCEDQGVCVCVCAWNKGFSLPAPRRVCVRERECVCVSEEVQQGVCVTGIWGIYRFHIHHIVFVKFREGYR